MDDHLDIAERARPVGARRDLAEDSRLRPHDRRRIGRQPHAQPGDHLMPAACEAAAHRAADKPAGPGHQDPRHPRNSCPAVFRERSRHGCIKEEIAAGQPRTPRALWRIGLSVLLTPTIDTAPAPPEHSEARPKLLILITEDWFFCSHRLATARAAREAGYEVVVATRVRNRSEERRV